MNQIQVILIMNIQNLLLVSLSVMLGVGIWGKMLPTQQFAESTCMIGQISRPSGTEQVLDCSSCVTFPIQTRQSGRVWVRSGNVELQQNQPRPSQEYQLYANLYMQKQCIEYQCQNLINKDNFANQNVVSSAGLILTDEVFKYVDQKVWEMHYNYDNYLSSAQPGSEVATRLMHYLMGPILPSVLLPGQQFYKGMALKFRYTQPLQNIETVSKPIIKLTQTAETRSDLVSLSIIIAFTLAFKSNFFQFGHSLKILNLIVCLNFISPYLFSLLALLLLAIRNPLHVLSIFSMTVALCTGYPETILISVIISSAIILRQSHKLVSMGQIAWFIAILLIAILNGIESIQSSSICLFFVLVEDISGGKYQKIENRQKGHTEFELKESEDMMIEE